MNKQIQFKVSAVVARFGRRGDRHFSRAERGNHRKVNARYWVGALVVSLVIAIRVQAASTIQFIATSYTVAESAGTAPLTVHRTGDIATEIGVDYATADGTATNGLKYRAVSGTLTFSAG